MFSKHLLLFRAYKIITVHIYVVFCNWLINNCIISELKILNHLDIFIIITKNLNSAIIDYDSSLARNFVFGRGLSCI